MNNKKLLPLFLITFGTYLYAGTIWVIQQSLQVNVITGVNALLATLLLVNIYLLILEQTKNQALAVFIAVIVGFSAPILIYSTQATVEILLSLLILYSFRKISRHSKVWRYYILLILTIGFLLWTKLQHLSFINLSFFTIGQGFLAFLIDRTFGLIPYAPIYIFSFAGLFFVYKNNKKMFWQILVIFLSVYLFASAGATNITWAPPGRDITPVVSLLSLPIAYAFLRLRLWSKILFVFIAAWGISVGTQLVSQPDLNYSLATPKLLYFLNLKYSIPIIFPKLLVADQLPRLTAKSIELSLLWLILIVFLTFIIAKQSHLKSQR